MCIIEMIERPENTAHEICSFISNIASMLWLLLKLATQAFYRCSNSRFMSLIIKNLKP